MIGKYKKDMIKTGKELYDKGILIGTDGNMSIRVSDDQLLITASGVCKGKLTEKDIVLVNFKGEVLEGPKPARDIRMHLAVYEMDGSARAIVHAHPPAITGCAITKMSMDRMILPEVAFNLGDVVMTRYTTPTTIEVPMEIKRILGEGKKTKALILANHGATTWGNDIFDAFYKMQTLEMYIKALVVSRILGEPSYLSNEEAMKIRQMVELE